MCLRRMNRVDTDTVIVIRPQVCTGLANHRVPPKEVVEGDIVRVGHVLAVFTCTPC